MRFRSILPVFVAALVAVIFTTDAMAMYHPGLGRHMQRDPHGTSLVSTANRIGGNGVLPGSTGFIARDAPNPAIQYWDGMNLYQYVRSQPLTNLDPTGLYTLGQAAQSYCRRTTGRSRGGRYNQCRRNLMNNPGRGFDVWLEAEKNDTGWLGDIPSCPSSIEVCDKTGEPKECDNGDWGGLSDGWAVREFHPRADYCMRSRDFNGSAQQCCYELSSDGKSLNLIKSGESAGTPDRASASGILGSAWHWLADTGHIGHDVSPFNRASELGRINDYLMVRPPSQGGGGCYE